MNLIPPLLAFKILLAVLVPALSMAAESVLFVTHSSRDWDFELKFRAPIERVVHAASNRSFLIVNNELEQIRDIKSATENPNMTNWFVKGMQPEEFNSSRSGDHAMVANAKQVVVVGGHFSMCLCRTIRDALVHTFDSQVQPTITVVMDAVYEGLMPAGWNYFDFLEMGGTKLPSIYRDRPQKELLEYIRGLPRYPLPPSLHQISQKMNDQEFMNYLATSHSHTFAVSFVDVDTNAICGAHRLSGPYVTLNIERHGHPLRAIGKGSHKARIRFITVDEFIKEGSEKN